VDEQWLALRHDLTQAGTGPLYARLSDAIRTRILDGRLPVDVRLPAERLLAEQLGVSRNTVIAALDPLRAGGFVESRRGARSMTRSTSPSPRRTARSRPSTSRSTPSPGNFHER
jgi:DNA-binding GntR family transcriptional regulator